MKSENRKYSVCFFGTYESTFPRTRTLMQACRLKGFEILECHRPFWENMKHKFDMFSVSSAVKTGLELMRIYAVLALRYLRLKDHDVVVVGYNGYFDMFLAWLLTRIRRKILVFTPVFPLYETLVEDRKYVNPDSLKSRIIHWIDEKTGALADLIIIETETYLNYYSREFKIPKEKFHKIPLGADEKNFYPRPSKKQSLTPHQIKVLFYGKFIPLQGISYIVKAAKMLEKHNQLEFEVIGSGQLTPDINRLARKLNVQNIDFIEWIDYKELPEHILDAHICLGIFGSTPKAQRGIPIKVYEALAVKKPVITGNTPAAREVFTDQKNAVLCNVGDPKALAESIVFLKDNNPARESIAEQGNKLYQKVFSSQQIANKWEMVLNKCFQK
ncbi:MAG: glycosyltransferase [Candidatus Aminicenantes bacterium]|nr:glycosyltransferase [Candidatus Aminicenantes bacterium]